MNNGRRALLRSTWLATLLAAALALVSRAVWADPPSAQKPIHIGDPVPVVISVPPPAAPPPATPKIAKVPEDLARFAGRPITRVDVQVDDDTWPAKPPAVTRVLPGTPLSAGAARRALAELLESGRFARGRVTVADDGAGVRMTLRLVQRRLVEMLRVDLHGAPIDRDDLLREADLAEGGEILGVDLPAYEQRMQTYLARRGYPTSSVTIQTRETDDPGRMLVLVDAAAGAARTIQRRAFYVFGADAQKLSSVLDGYRVDRGARADETALDAADAAMEARLRALGHHRADVSHDLVYASGLVTLRVRVDAGPLFAPRFEGNERYDATALTGALGLEDESDLAPGHLTQKIREFYVKRGFLDVDVTLETRGGEHDRRVDLVFHVTEHPPVKVGTRTYPCLKLEDIQRLDGGGPTSPQEIGQQIDSYLEEELPGADLVRSPDPRGLDPTLTGGDALPRAAHAAPFDLDPDATFSADTYDRAALHVQELYRNEGFLHAQVGPVLVVRRQCDPRSPPGTCTPIVVPASPPDECAYDTTNLPLPVPPLEPAFTCTPDPARGIECEPAVTLRIPIKLGPRTMLYDMQFSGARAISERTLARVSELVLGQPANVLKLEDARRKIIDAYKEEGYYYADVKYTLDASVDHTRARVRFEVFEGDQVRIRQIVIRGNLRTNEWAIRRRLAFDVGQAYRTSDVKKTQERIATLNVFSSINIGLEDPYVPQKSKIVVIQVVERLPQSVDYTVGLSTGEGIRGELGYAHANIGGDAIGFSMRMRLSYLPDELIFDPLVRQNFDTICPTFCGDRLAYRITTSLSFPEVGLGPLVRMQLDGVVVHDLEHDFVLDKQAAIPGFYYRPFRELLFVLSQSLEKNKVDIFEIKKFGSIAGYLAANPSADLAVLLRFPDVPSHAFAQRFVTTYDRRDNTFNPHKGTFFVSGVEHVDWFGEASETLPDGSSSVPSGHTLRFTETFAFYVPVTRAITLASELRLGTNVQLVPNSRTYPDRAFFLGGVSSMRGYVQDSMVPQDIADQIARGKTSIDQVAFRGGDLMINPKVELRIPVRPPLGTVLFVDTGNVWQDPTYVLDHGIAFRTTAGSGLRVDTPIGPLAFDYGVNMSRLFSSPTSARRTYEDFGAFHFAIGLF